MENKRDYHERLADEKKLADLVNIDPNLTQSEQRPQFIPEHLALIGIDYNYDVLGDGFIKVNWADFIVEEITTDFRVVNIEVNENYQSSEVNPEKPKTGTDLVKQGMPTIEAVERLAEAFKIDVSQIGYAGMKDSTAITSQEISFNGLRPERISEFYIPNLFLKNIHERKGIVEIGGLYGNRFTILVRSEPHDLEKLKLKVDELNAKGFYNFYSLQRFGPRLMSHKIGGRILRGEYEEAAKMFLVGDSIHDRNAFRNIRSDAATYWGQWDKMQEVFSVFPYFFYYELRFLESLKASPDFTVAFKAVDDQTKMCVFAFFSYWFNKLLSKKILEGSVPEFLPLLRGFKDAMDAYREIIPPDQFSKIRFNHTNLEFLNLTRPQKVQTRVTPKIWHVYETEVGYVFHFDLLKGAYATTMLSEFFHLYQGKPVPEWVSEAECDTREILGYAPIVDTINKFPKGEEKDKVEISTDL